MSTLVVGASVKPERYAHRAILKLQEAGETVHAFGLRSDTVNGIEILTDQDGIQISDLDTITLYVGAKRQPPLMDWLISLKARRVIFNPGTENPEFYRRLVEAKIEVVEACTLVMLSIGNY